MSSEIVKGMIIENMMDDYPQQDGYEKRDLYNVQTINELAVHYKEILKLIGESTIIGKLLGSEC